jgi:hypothetical protein
MIIVDKIKAPSPFFTRKPHPTVFKSTYEEQKYWAQQKKYWVEGYSEDVNGMLYFYAQEIILKDRIRGSMYYPTVRDADVLISQKFKETMDAGYAMFFLKARGIGFSSWGMNLPFYFARVFPNSKSIITSKDKSTLSTLFTDKTMVAYEEMNPRIKPDLINKNQTKSDAYLKIGMKYINQYGEEKYGESEISFRDTQESPKAATAFSGSGAMYGFADEAPLMPRLMQFYPSAIECFTDHSINKIVGGLIMGGTAEATITPDDIRRIQDIYTNSEALRIKTLFLPATYGKHMVNGHSNHEKAREEILKRREELSNLEDKSQLTAYVKNNPLDINDIFDFAGGGLFDEYTVEKVNAQLRELPKVKQEMKPVAHKINVSATTVVAEPVKESSILILEHPKEGVDYIVGGDTIMTSDLTSSASGNSKYAAVVTKGVDPQGEIQFAPVATYLERPKSIEHANIQLMNLAKYYNQYGRCKIMCELNAGAENLLQMLINEGLSRMIMLRKDLNKSGWVDRSKPWFYRADIILRWQIEAANIYFKKYSHMVFFKELLIDATKGSNDNTDILDAFMAALYGWGTGNLLENKTHVKIVKKIQMVKYEMVDGRLVPKWYEKELKV